jgi:hypothetical protein
VGGMVWHASDEIVPNREKGSFTFMSEVDKNLFNIAKKDFKAVVNKIKKERPQSELIELFNRTLKILE